jgi:hypothetical protein
VAQHQTPAPIKKSPKLQEAEKEVVAAPKAQVQVDEPAPAPEPKVETKSVDDYNDIDAALDDLDFDD